jgi:hypothetical protein
MNCIEFRQLMLADPYEVNNSAIEHGSNCIGCSRFESEILTLDGTLRHALSVDVPEGFAAKVLLNQSLQSHPRKPTRWVWLSMAASFFLAIIVYQVPIDAALGDEIITHLEHEAHQVHGNSGDISTPEIQQVLYAVDGELDSTLGKITYASKCLMGDQLVAHFVVEDGGVPYTLIIIPTEIDRQQLFKNELWRGLITPHETGSLAVVANAETDPEVNLHTIAERYGNAIKQTKI